MNKPIRARRFSKRSEKNLLGVQPALTAVVRRALELSEVDFTVIEGVRTMARQKQLVAKGASQTMNSRHLTGHAVDIAPYIGGQIRWDWPPFHKLADAMKQAADELGVKLTWGGDWKSFKDGPHFELHWGTYPSTETATVGKSIVIDTPVSDPQPEPKASPWAGLFKTILSIFGGKK